MWLELPILDCGWWTVAAKDNCYKFSRVSGWKALILILAKSRIKTKSCMVTAHC